MNLYYALGGGLGHITRAHAFLHTLGLENNSVILSSCPFLPDERLTGKIHSVKVGEIYNRNVPAFKTFLQTVLNKYSVETIFLDTFPAGISGEFIEFDFPRNVEIIYVARLLKWKAYSSLLKKADFPQFVTTYLLEPVEEKHQTFINEHSKKQLQIELRYPEAQLSFENDEDFRFIISRKKPFWLIAHSGSENEVTQLIHYADEMRGIEKSCVNLILVSPHDFSFPQIPNLTVFNFFPALVLFEHAERIFTACGFNSMNQMREFRNKHFFIPFERRFDDQFERAGRINMNKLI